VRFDLATQVRAWALTARDMCDQGATSVRLTFPGDITIHYSPERGARVFVPDSPVIELADADLDAIDLVPA
jgi:hypothetical protein